MHFMNFLRSVLHKPGTLNIFISFGFDNQMNLTRFILDVMCV